MSHYYRKISLNEGQQADLVKLRDSSSKPYIRERAAAILKIASGIPAAHVASNGLLKVRQQDTVRIWLSRYEQHGIEGLRILPGRGRKPAFSP